MKPFLEPLKIRRVKVRALNARFLIDGRPAEPGQEIVVDHSDALMLVMMGKAEILGDAPARTIPVRDLHDPPPIRRVVG